MNNEHPNTKEKRDLQGVEKITDSKYLYVGEKRAQY